MEKYVRQSLSCHLFLAAAMRDSHSLIKSGTYVWHHYSRMKSARRRSRGVH